MYAIVDIETTGGRPKSDKITEIAIVLFDGERVIEEFSTLIDPERKIPYKITQITGIDDRTVRGAPKFYEVAKRIFEMTEEHLFIAHNVNFDFGFIKAEFESLGGAFKRKKLCTVQMSRKLLPGKRSYSLGNLCLDLGIENAARHRAMGDAKATTELFKYLLRLEGMNANNLLAPGFLKDLNTKVNLDIIQNLPEETGVYYFFDSADQLIYVGKSLNIKSRVISHLGNNTTMKAQKMQSQISRVEYKITGSELVALLKESDEIKRNQPVFNRSQRRTYYSYGIVCKVNDEGYNSLRIEKLTNSSEPILSFSTKITVREHLFRLVEKHELCQQICHLYPAGGPCFNYSIDQCNGACIGEETTEEYNYRVQDAINELTYHHRDFIIVDKGRDQHEKSVILVENGVYKGFGYLNEEEPIKNPKQLEEFIDIYENNRDIQQIIRSYLTNKNVEKIVEY